MLRIIIVVNKITYPNETRFFTSSKCTASFSEYFSGRGWLLRKYGFKSLLNVMVVLKKISNMETKISIVKVIE